MHAANEGADIRLDALSFEDDVQMVVSVQISHRLHPQLFDDLSRAKKRERAERIRWLCLYGLAAEKHALMHMRAASISDASPSTREFAPTKRYDDAALTQTRFALPPISNLGGGTDETPSVMSHPDVGDLLL